jgi:hypothetical protein
MNLSEVIFGAHPSFARSPVTIKTAPRHARWRKVRPKPDGERVRARRAEADHKVTTQQGELRARGGEDFIVTYENGDRAVVRQDIFEKTYEPAGIGVYKKRSDIVLRYFTLERPALIHTLEGEQRAEPGDWIMQGVAGELWPVPQDQALQKYDPL